MDQSNTVAACARLHVVIETEQDPRARMQACRQSLGMGRSAVMVADRLSDQEITDIQNTLRLAYRTSKGVYNANAAITKLAKVKMKRLGLSALPIVSATRAR